MVSGSAGYPDRAKARDRAQRWGELAGTGRNMGVISCIVAKLYGSPFICMPFATVAPDAYNRGLLGIGWAKALGVEWDTCLRLGAGGSPIECSTS